MAGQNLDTFSLADPAINQILQTLRTEIAACTEFRFLARAVTVFFPAANTPTEVLHGVTQVPDGRRIIRSDANITDTPGRAWTPDVAYLQSDRANSFCVVAFGMQREDALNVQASG